MTTAIHDGFVRLITASFPAKPIPSRFFWSDGEGTDKGNIPDELSNRIGNRQWTEVTLLDWRMTGAAPYISRTYLEPRTFVYYLPSLLVGALFEPDFIDWALEGIIPFNKHRVPRGKWWNEFARAISPDQRKALSTYISHIQLTIWDLIGPGNQVLAHEAQAIWS
jgi:hypothetical protein